MSYWKDILKKPSDDAAIINTYEDIFKKSVEAMGSLGRLRQQGGNLFKNGNLFTGLTELSKVAIGLSPANLGNINHILGPLGKIIPGGFMSLLLMGGLGAFTYYGYAKPAQKGAVPVNYPTAATVTNNTTTTNAPTPVRGNTTVIGANGTTTTTNSGTGSGSGAVVGGVIIRPVTTPTSTTGSGTTIATGNGTTGYTNPVTTVGNVNPNTPVSGSTAGGDSHGVIITPRG